MIPTGSVAALVGLDAIAVGRTLHDQNIAVAARFVADRPALDFWTPRRSANNVNRRRKRAFPSAIPIVGRYGRAASHRESYECE